MMQLNRRFHKIAGEDLLWHALLAAEVGEANLPRIGAQAWRKRFLQWQRLDSCGCEEQEPSPDDGETSPQVRRASPALWQRPPPAFTAWLPMPMQHPGAGGCDPLRRASCTEPLVCPTAGCTSLALALVSFESPAAPWGVLVAVPGRRHMRHYCIIAIMALRRWPGPKRRVQRLVGARQGARVERRRLAERQLSRHALRAVVGFRCFERYSSLRPSGRDCTRAASVGHAHRGWHAASDVRRATGAEHARARGHCCVVARSSPNPPP